MEISPELVTKISKKIIPEMDVAESVAGDGISVLLGRHLLQDAGGLLVCDEGCMLWSWGSPWTGGRTFWECGLESMRAANFD